MKLVVGLGNPGRRYEGTRHNVGYVVLNHFAQQHSRSRYSAARPQQNFEGEVTETEIAGQKILLLWPRTFMNLSGASVLAARDFYKLADDALLVVCDDFNLPLAKLRFRPSGSAGGQKGLADVIGRLGTEAVPRLRIGVGPVPDNWDGADFVLGKFTKHELPEIQPALVRAADAIQDWITLGIEECMNKYNA